MKISFIFQEIRQNGKLARVFNLFIYSHFKGRTCVNVVKLWNFELNTCKFHQIFDKSYGAYFEMNVYFFENEKCTVFFSKRTKFDESNTLFYRKDSSCIHEYLYINYTNTLPFHTMVLNEKDCNHITTWKNVCLNTEFYNSFSCGTSFQLKLTYCSECSYRWQLSLVKKHCYQCYCLVKEQYAVSLQRHQFQNLYVRLTR